MIKLPLGVIIYVMLSIGVIFYFMLSFDDIIWCYHLFFVIILCYNSLLSFCPLFIIPENGTHSKFFGWNVTRLSVPQPFPLHPS
jgi:hypothetical protein